MFERYALDIKQMGGEKQKSRGMHEWPTQSVLSHPVQCMCLVSSLAARLFLPQEGVQPSALEQLIV